MLKIYGFSMSPRSNKVLMCANALGIEYEYVQLNLLKGEHKTKEYLAIHPAGKIPAIDDNGFTLFESDAISKYLCKKNNSSLYPRDLAKQAIIDQWCDFISIHVDTKYVSILFNKVIAPQLDLDVDERSVREAYDFLKQYLPIIETQLDKTRYLAGDQLSVADICLLATVDPSEFTEVDLQQYSKLSAWRDNLRSQGFYQKVHQFYGESMTTGD